MPRLKFSPNLTYLFTEVGPLKDRFQAAKNAGFTAVEIINPYCSKAEELAQVLEKVDLKVIYIDSYPGSHR